ncbi:MAG: hypothetical protein AB8F74_22700 [Saprospiraceae bacterium]
MDYLIELVGIVNKQSIRNVDLMTDYTKHSKTNALYEGVHKGDFKTDRQAIEALYPEQGDSGKVAYRKLKERLIEQLVNTVLLIGTSSDLNKKQRNYFNAQKYSAAARLIRLRMGYKLSEMLAKKNIKLALKTEQTSIVVDMYDLLRDLMSRNGDVKGFEKYDLLFRQYNSLLQAEHQAKGYLSHIMLLSNRSVKLQKLIEVSRGYEEELRKVELESPSSTFIMRSHYVYVLRCEYENDLIGLQDECRKAVDLLNARKFVNDTYLFIFLFKNSLIYRGLQDFEGGKEALELATKYVGADGSVNWFMIKKNYVSLCLFCNKIQEGFSLYLSTVDNERLKKLPEGDQEYWSIYRYYFAWFRGLELLKVGQEEERLLVFSMKNLLKQKPIQSKDREGYNAIIMVLQFLFLIQQKNNDALIDRQEAVTIHVQRHFRQKELYRTFYFMKLLLLLPANNFNKIAVTRKAKVYLDKLKARSISKSSSSVEVEIVPYEDLWEIILDLL